MSKQELKKLNNVRQIISSINHNNYKEYNLSKIVNDATELKKFMQILGYKIFDKEKIGDKIFAYFIKKKATDIICYYDNKKITMYSV